MGKDEAGRAEPVQIKLRPRGVGIGFSDGEEEPVEEEFVEKKREAKRSYEPESKRAKESAPQFEVDTAFFSPSESVPIVDMTVSGSAEVSYAPNLLKLRQELLAKQRRLQAALNHHQSLLKDAQRTLQRTQQEISKSEQVTDELGEKIRQHQRNLAVMNDFRSAFDANNLEAWSNFLAANLDEEQKLSLLIPHYKTLLQVDSLLLNPVSALICLHLPDHNLALFYHHWWPHFRSHFTGFPVDSLTGWQECLQFCREWQSVLPVESFQLAYLAQQILLPRLHSILTGPDVDFGGLNVAFEFKDLFLLHLRMPREAFNQTLGEVIKACLSRLTKSAPLPQLLQNVRVIPAELLIQRLQLHLQRFLLINPADQDISPLEQVFPFKAFLPPGSMAHLFATEVVPKLRTALQKWLQSGQADLEEVATWYEAWKSLLESHDQSPELESSFGLLLSDMESIL